MRRITHPGWLIGGLTLAVVSMNGLAEEALGIRYVNDTTLKVYHVDEDWTGRWNYVCLNDQCLQGEKVDGRYEREFTNVTLGQTYNIGFKVQDDALGQHIASGSAVFSADSEPPSPTSQPTPLPSTPLPTAPPATATPQPTPVNTPIATPPPTVAPTPTLAPVPTVDPTPVATPAPTQTPDPQPTPQPTPVAFGYEAVNSNTMRLFHVDEGWTAGFAFMCVGTDCTPASRNNGRFERDVQASTGQSFDVEFKVQDNTIGEFVARDTFIFQGGGSSGGSNGGGGNQGGSGGGNGGVAGTPVPVPPPVTGGSNQNGLVNCNGSVCKTVFAERLTLRHQGDVLNNQYIDNYFSGGLYEIELTERGGNLEVHLFAPMPTSMVNFTYSHKFNAGFADPPQYNRAGLMQKHRPGGPANDSIGDLANHFYYTINNFQQYVEGGILTIEFTPRVPDGSGNAPQYYSDIIEYLPGGGITNGATYGGNTDKKFSGGPVTNYKQGAKNKYMAQAFLGINLTQMDEFLKGRRIFHADFVDGENFSGGPLFTKRACIDCHINDGRGGAPGTGDKEGYIIKVRNADDTGPHPVYGSTLDPSSVAGVEPEGDVNASGQLVNVSESVSSYGVRIAPPLIGIGLLEAIDDSTIEGFAARNGGRVARVNSEVKGANAIGRYGWKASVATIDEQVGSAYRNDMGVTNYLFPSHDLTTSQVDAIGRTSPGAEISRAEMDVVTSYIRSLAVPMRRHPEVQSAEQFNTNIRGRDAKTIVDSDVLAGEQAFNNAGCADCHIPEIRTGNSSPHIQFRNITIRPFTDLLLHDMGPELAGTAEDHASATEWRTPPLWGIRLTEQTIGQGNAGYMHDGRAKTLDEAIRLHGGEAAASRDAYLRGNREAILLYLKTL